MLPPVLSSGVCSLRPDEDRKTVTVEMEVDDGGRVLRTRFYRSLIRSDARLDYEQVERMFHGLEPIEPGLAAPLDWGRGLARDVCASIRQQRGSLQVESAEPEFEWDEDGQVVVRRPRARSWRATGSSRTSWYWPTSRWRPSWSGSRSPPSTGCTTSPIRSTWTICSTSSRAWACRRPLFDPMTATSEDVRRVTRETAEWIDTHAAAGLGKAALTQQVLRAQARAVYDTVNIGHFGLASVTYCHFTSPIRRYPDLLVHRALLGRLGLAPEPDGGLPVRLGRALLEDGARAAKIELKADDIVLAHLLKRRLDEEGWRSVFEGQVLSLTRRGMFVLFDRLVPGVSLDQRAAS